MVGAYLHQAGVTEDGQNASEAVALMSCRIASITATMKSIEGGGKLHEIQTALAEALFRISSDASLHSYDMLNDGTGVTLLRQARKSMTKARNGYEALRREVAAAGITI